jgi:hypothetical protein
VSATLANVTTANIGTAVITGTSTLTGLTASTALALDASKNIASVTNTGTGNNVLATSPTITTPTISSLTSAAATALTLQSAGTTAVTVDISQRVGIGTTSPSANLEVAGASGQNIYVTYNSGSQLRLKSDSGDSGIGTTGATPLLFLQSNGEKARIDTSGRVLVGLTSANTSGSNFQVSQGITFPATQSASSDVNTLDDYEEGTWTPVVNGQNQASCLYNKIGRLITLAGDITLSFTGGVQNTMSGLPFGVNSASQYGNVLPYQQNTAGPLSILVTTAATFNFYNGQSGQNNISTGSRLIFTISYLSSQ